MAAKCSERNFAKSSAPVQAAIFEKVLFCIYNVMQVYTMYCKRRKLI